MASVNPKGDETQAHKAAKEAIARTADEIHKKLTGHPTPNLNSLIVSNARQKPQRFGVVADCLTPFLAERELILQGMATTIVALQKRIARLERIVLKLGEDDETEGPVLT